MPSVFEKIINFLRKDKLFNHAIEKLLIFLDQLSIIFKAVTLYFYKFSLVLGVSNFFGKLDNFRSFNT